MASLEEKIDTLTTAVQELTAVMRSGGGAPAASSGGSTASAPAATGGKGKGKAAAAAKPTHTAAEMQAAVLDVKEKISSAAAKEIIEEHAGEGKKLADLSKMPEKFDAVVAACQAAIEAQGGGDEDEDEI